ncbi:MAG: acyl carrier protein [Planctomycetota bacterium]|jgi:acyl carrier protein
MGLDMIEVVLEVEDEFDIKISNLDASNIESIGDLFDLILKQIATKKIDGVISGNEKDAIWQRYKELLIVQLDLKPQEIIPSNRFFYELGFD